jgi:regulator of sigma E protease
MEDLNGPDSMLPKQMLLVMPGDVVTAVNGEAVGVKEYWKFDRALQASDGKPVRLTVKRADGKVEDVQVVPQFSRAFNAETISFAGMVPRASIGIVMAPSPARGKLLPDDVVLSISYAGGADPLVNPSAKDLVERLNKAGQNGQKVEMKVLRDGREVVVTDLSPNVKLKGTGGRYGLSIQLEYDDQHAVVASVEEKSPAAAAGVPLGAQITSINGTPVTSWFDVKRVIAASQAHAPLKIAANTPTGEKTYELKMDQAQIAQVAGYGYLHNLRLHEMIEPRKTSSPLIAAAWGVTETRDFILQFYVTLHRMFQGSVSYKNMMGPVGIFSAGHQFALKGADWLIWFLSMISANLAVVNFLPIPIVDGGLFTFLIIEKIQGRPLSPKTQSIAQVVGLAIIVGVFLLVTYQDVARMAH